MLIEAVAPLKIPINVVVDELPVTITFFTTLLVAPLEAVALATQITELLVPVFVLVIVRSLEDVPLFEPSMVT